MGFINSTAIGSDNQSGIYRIADNLLVNIALDKQMVIWGDFTIDGALLLDGQLILEP